MVITNRAAYHNVEMWWWIFFSISKYKLKQTQNHVKTKNLSSEAYFCVLKRPIYVLRRLLLIIVALSCFFCLLEWYSSFLFRSSRAEAANSIRGPSIGPRRLSCVEPFCPEFFQRERGYIYALPTDGMVEKPETKQRANSRATRITILKKDPPWGQRNGHAPFSEHFKYAKVWKGKGSVPCVRTKMVMENR